MKVKILCGVSGSGKSTYIKNNFPDAMVCSADLYFEKLAYDAGLEYQDVFRPQDLGKAHGWCLKRFAQEVRDMEGSKHDCTVVVDNTNTTVAEIAPYAALALAYGHELEIIILEAGDAVDLSRAWKRNAHGVPLQGVTNQHERLVKLTKQLPRWWPIRKVGLQF